MRSFYGLNTRYSASKPITNLNCVFISYTPQILSYYNANYNKNIVLSGKCLREWLPEQEISLPPTCMLDFFIFVLTCDLIGLTNLYLDMFVLELHNARSDGFRE